MIKGLQLLNRESESGGVKINRCPLCNENPGLNGSYGAICEKHYLLIKNYRWVMIYINSQEVLDNKVLHILEVAISDRKSYSINDVDVEIDYTKGLRGRLMAEEYLEKHKKCSAITEMRLKEIVALEKAREKIIEIMKEKYDMKLEQEEEF